MPGNFQPQSEITLFDKNNFKFTGIPFRHGYTEAQEICASNHLEWREEQVEKLRGASPFLVLNQKGEEFDLNALEIKEHRSLLRQFADELQLVKAVNADFAPFFDAAWARIFTAIVDGSLEIDGIDFERWVDLKEGQRYEDAGEFQLLPSAALPLTTDWKSNSVLYEYRDFVSLRCRTDVIAEMIAPRLMQTQPVEARMCAGFLWSSEPARTQKAKRGRAPALDWSVLRDRLVQQGQAGLLPPSKESCIYDLIAYAEAGHYHWQHEPAWYAVRGTGHWSGDRRQSTLWSIPNRDQDATTVHGTQKPVECMRRPMLNNASAGQAIYEPFSGSCTSIIAAESSGRLCLAIELDPAYVDVTVQRWQAFTGKNALLDGDGGTFDAVATKRGAEAA
ncbi:DNA methyltransferase [Roseobacter litoralis]|uniref:Methyltransferase n=1 Tax=Roseobacter litoralis (strain ATCC 49566 / DSM 6996 / JCM 21268 / NBRC 15278 / OCh 149) TaxID=391595 RepID=F7ZA45_ROSLO|nr:DNA methyltransferase [Roseobacter litoralis]AEI94198.1 hypothetical protein RLO149_c022220 [Roseobacter litoralis Och 149]